MAELTPEEKELKKKETAAKAQATKELNRRKKALEPYADLIDNLEDILKLDQDAFNEAVEALAAKLPKEDERKPVSFYFNHFEKNRLFVPGGAIEGTNHVATILPSDPLYDEKVAFMKAHAGNVANKGGDFFQMKSGKAEEGKENLLDELLDVPRQGLIALLKDRDGATMIMSRGTLMLKVLEEQGVV